MTLLSLSPSIEPYNTGMLKVADLHTIYYEEVGNPQGKPIIFVHGGPGAGASADSRRFFDPEFYRIILFDQRGCGHSTPHAELAENTTWDLVADMEKIREYLMIDRWVVFGGSWGSTLSLAYACRHPEKVVGLILRGIFLCRTSEIRWFYQEGASNIYPDEWDKYEAIIPEEERGDFVKAYYQRLTSPDYETRLLAARTWSIWEAATSHLYRDDKSIASFEDPATALAFARIECHYFTHAAFMPDDNYLLAETRKLDSIPTRIVQGRYDMPCPVRTAWDLHKAMPSADLRIIPDAGHSAMEPGITFELMQATEDFKKLYGDR